MISVLIENSFFGFALPFLGSMTGLMVHFPTKWTDLFLRIFVGTVMGKYSAPIIAEYFGIDKVENIEYASVVSGAFSFYIMTGVVWYIKNMITGKSRGKL